MVSLCRQVRVRLPSLTGTDAAHLEEVMPPLPSRVAVAEQVGEALSEMSASSDPVVALLVAEWGEGKTSVYNAKVAPWLERHGWLGLEVRTAALLAHLKSLRDHPEKDPAHRLLAALLAAGLESLGRGRPPTHRERLRDYVLTTLENLLSSAKAVLLFVDEFEDVVTYRDQEVVEEVVAGLVGLVNGDVDLVSARCRGPRCFSGRLHLMLSLTPPAYARLMSLKDFATVAARFKRRVRVVRVPPLSRKESYAFLEALARYSVGDGGLRAILESPDLANAIVMSSLGNMGALVSSFRFVVSYSMSLAEEAGCPEGSVAPLKAGELLSALSKLTLSIGGAELPALNAEVYERLREGWAARSKIMGLDVASALALLDNLVVRGVAKLRALSEAAGLPPSMVEVALSEMNVYGEESWPHRELGVRRMVYKVRLVDSVEELVKLSREVLRGVKVAGVDASSLVEAVLDALTFTDESGRLVVASPLSKESAADLIADASPVELSAAEASKLAALLWPEVFSKIASGYEAYMLSPRILRALYVSPELQYLDFIADRIERFNVNRRVYSESRSLHLVLGLVSLMSFSGLLVETPTYQSESAVRAVVQLLGQPRAEARVLLYTTQSELTVSEAKQVESQVTTAILSSWRPHAVLVVYYRSAEPEALKVLASLERKLFVKTLAVPLEALVDKVKLTALGVKLAEKGLEAQSLLSLAYEVPRSRSKAEELGLDFYRLQAFLKEMAEKLELGRRLRDALAEGVEGVPLLIRDPVLGYDVERPTELAGALRYYLVVPSARTTPRQALSAAYEYVLRYHLFRHGGEGRGLLSPDIDRRELLTLERYTALLVANKMLQRLDGELRVDVLSPAEQAVIRALEQCGGAADWVPASQVWGALVLQISNPGTKKMLLQSLVYRGIVEASSRKIDPEKARLRLAMGEAGLEKLVARARELLDKLASNYEALKWGYVVSAKLRDYRCGSVRGLIHKARQIISLAEDARKAGNVLMGLRLAKTLTDLLEYFVEDVVENYVLAAAKSVARFRAELEELVSEACDLKTALEELLREYVVEGDVEVVVKELEDASSLLEELKEIEELELDEDELERRVRELWAQAIQRSPREPGRYTPFYVNGMGPKVYFNYKYWLVYEAASRRGLAELSSEGLRASSRLRGTVEALAGLVDAVRGGVEQALDIVRRLSEISAKLREVGIPLPDVPARLVKVRARGALGLSEVERLVEEWRRRLEESVRPLKEAELLGLEVSRLHELVVVERGRAQKLVEDLEDLESRLAELGLAELSEVAASSRKSLLEALKESEAASRKLKSLGLEVEVTRLASTLREAKSLLEYSLVVLRKGIDEALKARDAVMSKIRLEVSRLEHEARALAELLRKVGVNLAVTHSSKQDLLERLEELLSLSEKMRRELKSRSVLKDEELKAYLLVMEEKSRRRELLLSEAAELIASKLGIEVTRARALLVNLIAKGVLEPRI